jgi:ArsR family transcriptional regulator, cadmium/lead-responsive transcriptional repressor
MPTQYFMPPDEGVCQSFLISRMPNMKQLSGPFRLPTAPARSDLVAKYFRGLGDPLRVRILGLLRTEGELSVGELVERLGEPQPKVSNHLACLRWCGFVEARREHRTILNRVADPRVVEMLDLANALLADNAEHVAACCRIDGA